MSHGKIHAVDQDLLQKPSPVRVILSPSLQTSLPESFFGVSDLLKPKAEKLVYSRVHTCGLRAPAARSSGQALGGELEASQPAPAALTGHTI